MRKVIFVCALSTLFCVSAKANATYIANGDSTVSEYLNWYNKDAKENKIQGVSTEKAYREILNKKKSRKVVVAVIDSGVDIEHEDLKGKIWTNTKEIPGNGKDDDNNGYIDDIHGWNYLGAADGQNIEFDNIEATRIYRTGNAKFGGKEAEEIAEADKAAYEMYVSATKEYFEERKNAEAELLEVSMLEIAVHRIDSIWQVVLGEGYTIEDIKAFKPDNEDMKRLKTGALQLDKAGLTKDALEDYVKHVSGKTKYYYNINWNARDISGDDPADISDIAYGNNDVRGLAADHGTAVAGIIGATRNNNIGINGICDNVEIMCLRAVPDGDENDKDVARAIRYAADHGAHIINMSFGKDYSPYKHMVDEAIQYAQEKGVLLIHAAGNDAENNDHIIHYPSKKYDDQQMAKNYIIVGASAWKSGKTLTASFSNYGKTMVDVFAPGVQVYTTTPDNKYEAMDGTSFASPVTAGVAALIMSYYPTLTAADVKEIILTSSVKYKKKVLLPGAKTKTRLYELCTSGGLVNAYQAVLLAEQKTSK